ncbi:hypothetical protein CFP56_033804 [Quercus suber]|uniref:NADH dehydrogenase subunit 4L n=1 Tax=Quercus suber TaxID=58331 RepID=A0AAW0LSB5_QUESU
MILHSPTTLTFLNLCLMSFLICLLSMLI